MSPTAVTLESRQHIWRRPAWRDHLINDPTMRKMHPVNSGHNVELALTALDPLAATR
jgi:hypothetical protein